MLPILSDELDSLKQKGLYRFRREVESAQGPHVSIDGRDYLHFCSNNYLGFANHPSLKAASSKAIQRYGCSAAASPLISGHMSPHQDLESHLSQFFPAQSSLVFPSGYMANLGAITSLVGKHDVIFSDELNHRSIVDACRLSRARTIIYHHRDVRHLSSLLTDTRELRRRLIVTDGVFSMDGDLAPLPELVDLAESHEAILMVDDAHGTGVLGNSGRGIHEHFGVESGIDVLMTSGSKSLGTFGGFIAGNVELIDLLRNRASSYIYTTALPPDQCMATIAALDLIDSQPDHRERLWSNVRILRRGLIDLDYDLMCSETQIIPIRIGDSDRAVEISNDLFERGILLTAIRPPTVPEGESRLRISVMATHNQSDLTQLVDALSSVRKRWF